MNATIHLLQSGGAFITINGVDRWFPSRRSALDELEALKPRTTIDYPLASDPGAHQNAEANA